jgi:hypothetical protein
MRQRTHTPTHPHTHTPTHPHAHTPTHTHTHKQLRMHPRPPPHLQGRLDCRAVKLVERGGLQHADVCGAVGVHKRKAAADKVLGDLGAIVQLHDAGLELRDDGHVVGLHAKVALHARQQHLVQLRAGGGGGGGGGGDGGGGVASSSTRTRWQRQGSGRAARSAGL